MSTTSKGDRFELKTQKLLTQVLRNGRFELKLEGESEFWIVPKDSDVFNKKKYKYVYGSKVIIDVSIESPVESEVPSLVIVECKDLSRKVDKGDMGEFCLKVQDLNAKKGIFVTNNGFQKGAIEMAKYHNIALIRIDEKNTLVWDLHRIRGFRNISYLDITELLISDVPTMPSVVFDGYIYYTSVIDYFYSLFYSSDLRLDKKIPFYSNEQIQKQVDLFLNGKKYIKISNEILKFYIIRQNILLCNETVSTGFLGRYDFYNNKMLETAIIYIDACASAVGIANGLFIFFRLREQWIAWYICAFLEAVINIMSGQYVLLPLKLGYFTNTTYGYIKWSRYIKEHQNKEKASLF